MSKFVDEEGVKTLWGQVKELHDLNKDKHINVVKVGDVNAFMTEDSATGYGQVVELPVTKDLTSAQDTDLVAKVALKPMQDSLDALNEVVIANYTKFSMSVSPSTIEKGVATSVNVTWNATFNNAKENPSVISVKKGGEEISNDATKNGTSCWTGEVSDSTSFSANATIKGLAKNASATVNAYHPMYFFASELAEMTSEAILGVTGNNKKIQNGGTITFNKGQLDVPVGQYLWVCVPSGKTLKQCVANDSVPYQFNEATVVMVDGKDNYNCYRLPNAVEGNVLSNKYVFTIA